MKKLLLLLAAVFASCAADGQLAWRISIKLIADAAGNPAPNAFVNISNEVVLANQLLNSYGRGYQFRLTEITNLTGVSQWYDIQARNDSNKLALQAAARANPSQYALRNDAINVYVVNAISGVCSFSRDGDDIILVGADAYRTLVLHECGHFFNLEHTHLGEDFRNANNTTCTNGCSCAQLIAGEADFTLETAADHECYASLNAVAQGAFGASFTNLNADQQWRVNNTWRNIMSYHPQEILDILTSDQLDRMTDESNGPRNSVASGRTWFVSTAGNDGNSGSSSSQFRTLNKGLMTANNGEIVLLRGGNYNERPFINQSVTLRATRGPVTIGTP